MVFLIEMLLDLQCKNNRALSMPLNPDQILKLKKELGAIELK